MKNIQKIGSGQLMIMLISSRVAVALTYSFDVLKQDMGNVSWVDALIFIPVILILAIPAFYMFKSTNMSILDSAYAVSKPLGTGVGIILALFCLSTTIVYVSRFNIFMTTTMQTEQSVIFYPALMIIPACYAAIKGIEALARTSGIISIIGIFSLLVILIVVFRKFDMANILSPTYYDLSSFWDMMTVLISNTVEIIILLIMFPKINGNIKKSYVGFSIISSFLMFIIFFTTVATLGSFASHQKFPFYSVANIAEIGELKQLSALHASTWILGLFIKCSLFLYLFYNVLSSIIPEKFRKLSIALASLVIFITSSLLSSEYTSSRMLFIGNASFYLIIFLSVILPMVITILYNIKKKKSMR